MIELLYLCAFCLVLHAYVGYWLCLRFGSRKRPVAEGLYTPTISVLIAARNEAANLPRKLANVRALAYPQDMVEIIVVSDGSTDETAAIIQHYSGIRAIVLQASVGKAQALNHAAALSTGELLFFLDVRQTIDLDALQQLVRPFSDTAIGAVSGELMLETEQGTPSGEALGFYWRIEKSIRRLESESGSVIGATGAIYLMRRELFQPLPAGLILDDVLLPMQVVRQGRRVLFQPAAIARDRLFVEPGREFRRKVRTLTGNLQLVQLAPWLLSTRNPVLFRFVSHKMLRLLVPFLVAILFVTAALSSEPVMKALLFLQILLLALAVLGASVPLSRRWRVVSIPFTLLMLNVAAALAFYKFVARKSVWN